MAKAYTTYKDKVSGETLYVSQSTDLVSRLGQSTDFTEYFKDKAMRILHRRDGPAIEYANGYKEWRVNNILHRLNGPAVEGEEGYKLWYVDGVVITRIYSSGKYEGPETLQYLQDYNHTV